MTTLFKIIKTKKLGILRLLLSSLMLGISVCGMHYVGMAAMNMDADLLYKPDVFILSVLIAIGASLAALVIVSYMYKYDGGWRAALQISASLIIGFAVCGMHYTGVEAAVFLPYPDCRYDPNQSNVEIAIVVGGVSSIIFSLATIFGLFNRRYVPASSYSGQKVFLQLGGLLTLFVVLIVGTSLFLNDTIKRQKIDEAYLKVANVQRALIERYTRHSLEALALKETEHFESASGVLSKQGGLVDNNYTSFLKGGDATLDMNGDIVFPIYSVDIDDVRRNAIKSFDEWQSFRELVSYSLSDKEPLPTNPSVFENIKDQSYKTIHAQDKVVQSLFDHLADLEDDLFFLQEWTILAVAILFVITLLYARFVISRRIDNARITLENHQEKLEKKVAEKTQDLRKAMQAANKAKEEAEKANVIKSSFLANMSHELRTPLNSIIGMNRMMAEDAEKNGEAHEMLEIMHKSSLSLLDLVNDILDLSKIEAGEVVLENIVFDFKELVTRSVEGMKPVASAKGVSLKCQYLGDPISEFIGDPTRVSSVINNLIGNAVKYTPYGHVKVNVECYVHDAISSIYFQVVDTGVGIAKDKQSQIFEKFSQEDETTTRRFGGTGLGLAITKDLVEMMGGTIGVESDTGEGSTFWFKIDFSLADTEQSFFDVPQQSEIVLNHIADEEKVKALDAKILIAEDHDMNQALIKKAMARMGFVHVDIVENGKVAVQKYKEGNYNIILMDCHMPEMNGYDATKEIRELEGVSGVRIPIIAMTADAMLGTREKCINAGMTEYISKPIDVPLLKKILENWILFPKD